MNNSSSLVKYYLFRDSKPYRGKTTPIQKGLVISQERGNADLSEEGVGFGVPILQYRRDFYFPGSSKTSNDGEVEDGIISKVFILDLIEREQSRDDAIESHSWIYQRIYNFLYLRGVRIPFKPISKLLVRKINDDRSIHASKFFRVKSRGSVLTEYEISENFRRIDIHLDFKNISRHNLQNIFISNELGGSVFTQYYDSRGLKLSGQDIGEWKKVEGHWAMFYSPKVDLGFHIRIPQDSEVYRGREIIGNEICWSGLIFKVKPDCNRFKYTILLGDRPYLNTIIHDSKFKS